MVKKLKLTFQWNSSKRRLHCEAKGLQKNSVCEEIGTAGEFTCTLVTGKPPIPLSAGEMTISVKGDDPKTYGVSKITGRKATVVAPSATGSKRIRRNI